MALITSTAAMNRELRDKFNHCSKWIGEIENNTPNSLYAIMQQHRRMWAEGVQHSNFGPDKYGMFRTDSIDNLTLDSLYLGDINGIWTNKASVFEQPDFKYVGGTSSVIADDTKGKQLTDDYIAICQQYKRHLLSNLRAMRSNIYDHGYGREKICAYIEKGFSEIMPNNGISNLKILNQSIADNKVLDVEFSRNGKIVNSTVVNIDGEFYLPEGFEKGVRMEPSKITGYNLISLYDAMNGNERYRQFGKNDLKSEITADKKSEMSRKTVKDNVKHVSNYSKSKGVKFGM